MKYFSKIVVSLILIISMLLSTVSCVDLGGTSQSGSQSGGENQKAEFYIKGDNTLYMNVGESLALELVIPEDAKGEVEWTSSHSCVSVQGGVVTANDQGVAVVKAMLGDYVEVGCNTVLNPGTVVGKNTNIYPLSRVRGVIMKDSIYKDEHNIVLKEVR